MPDIIISQPEAPALVRELNPIVMAAEAFAVLGAESYSEAASRSKRLRDGAKAIGDYFEPARKAADNAVKAVRSARDGLIGPLNIASQTYANKALNWKSEQDRIAEEERRHREVEARRAEEDRKLAEAEAAEKAGDHEQAEAIIREPITAPVIRIEPTVPKVEGIGTRKTWSAEVVDFRALVIAAADRLKADDLEALNWVQPNQVTLNKLAVALRDTLRVPGVRAVCKEGLTGR